MVRLETQALRCNGKRVSVSTTGTMVRTRVRTYSTRVRMHVYVLRTLVRACVLTSVPLVHGTVYHYGSLRVCTTGIMLTVKLPVHGM